MKVFIHKRRHGMTLAEMIGVMIIIAILVLITVGGVTYATYQSRLTKTRADLDGYKSAFLNSALSHPGIISDRVVAWEGGYSSEEGLLKTVTYMNSMLDSDKQFVWNDETGYFESNGNDPWGGKYILTEYPIPNAESTVTNYYDATVSPGSDVFALSIWATGNTDGLLSDPFKIKDDSIGIALTFFDGLVSDTLNGFDGVSPFKGCTLKFG